MPGLDLVKLPEEQWKPCPRCEGKGRIYVGPQRTAPKMAVWRKCPEMKCDNGTIKFQVKVVDLQKKKKAKK